MKRRAGGRRGSELVSERAEDAARRAASFPFWSTGSAPFDGLLGGGIRAGRLVQIFGKSSSGRSQVAMQTALLAAERGERSLYIDTEGSFRPERLEQIADARGWEKKGVLERVIYVRSVSAQEQMETIRSMSSREETASCRVVIIDTLTKNFSVELPGDTNLQSRQAALGVHLSEMARDAYIGGRAYLLTNRVTFGATRDVGIGGKTLEQLVHQSVMFERRGGEVRAKVIPSGEEAVLGIGRSGIT